MAKINPFCPGSPVPPGTFSGRLSELDQINRGIFQTANGFPQNLLIVGERGIGKTSMAHVTKSIAEKNVVWDKSEQRAPVITPYIPVHKNVPSAIVLTQVVRELNDLVSQTTALKNYMKDFMEKFKGISLAGIGYTLQDKEFNSAEIYIEAENSIRALCKKLSEKNRDPSGLFEDEATSICIIIDELDQMGDFNSFSSFWKTLQEKLAADNCRNLMLVLVGMPEIREKLVSDHESFLRTFTPIFLEKMPEKEAQRVILTMLEKGTPKKEITQDAINKIFFYSEYYPYLIQELGYSAFEVSQGDKITLEDVEMGIHGNNEYRGSITRLGELFFSRMYQEVIKSENYSELLKIIAKFSSVDQKWVPRQALLENFSKKKTSLDANLQSLVGKELIIRNPQKWGEYKLVSKMFQVYVEKFYVQEK